MRYKNFPLAATAKSYKVLKRNKKIVMVCVILLFVRYFFQNYGNFNLTMKGYALLKGRTEYLVDTTNCQIPETDPFDETIKKFVRKENYTDCSNMELLTYITKDFDKVTLNINSSVLPQYINGFRTVSCCYSEIYREEGNDDKVRFTSCKRFKGSVPIHQPFVKVVCRNKFARTVYENVHATTFLDYPQYRTDLKSDSEFSILFVGADAISKQNLRRTMPKTYQYLEKHFVNLRGYNKIDDNTYPNLMAILTGENMEQLAKSCPFFIKEGNVNKDKDDKDFLSACNFIWKKFSQLGYITALGEDASPLGTFNYAKRGFSDPPTDYYYRPYFLAAEQLKSVPSKCHVMFCSGPENSGERLLNVAKDFSVTFKNHPSFGFFWMNSFSHDNFNCPSTMDDKVLQFLSDQDFIDSLKNTIFVFYSDHGFRYGGLRQTYLGYLEERLPFMYIRIPDEFQRQLPWEYGNLLINSRRLTTPYDLYNTLQHVLELQNSNYRPPGSLGCPQCQSLFKGFEENRTCEEAGVNAHWCACINYHHISTTNLRVEVVTQLVIAEINDLVHSFPEGYKCALYRLDRVHLARVSDAMMNADKEMVVYMLLMIDLEPGAKFEVTVEMPVEHPHGVKVIRRISRISFYGNNVYCITDYQLMKYCYCRHFNRTGWGI